ncbi:hypothetical protein HMPREF3216_00534 [Gardnerella vaginalis]|uniref:Uncharacterized protein n=1 Tax=Gardnerella vaginalis TaxID=2702 RepID=A0A133NPY1_GARVA|nr:hypothetical protein HMPREF3216_00534 [Gardnerella vaginalis]
MATTPPVIANAVAQKVALSGTKILRLLTLRLRTLRLYLLFFFMINLLNALSAHKFTPKKMQAQIICINPLAYYTQTHKYNNSIRVNKYLCK